MFTFFVFCCILLPHHVFVQSVDNKRLLGNFVELIVEEQSMQYLFNAQINIYFENLIMRSETDLCYIFEKLNTTLKYLKN